MPVCRDCKMFMPTMFMCSTANMIVRADTDACEKAKSMQGISKCGDCKMFMPALYHCNMAGMGGRSVQVSKSSSACDAFMPK
jgi:hypothetical protein